MLARVINICSYWNWFLIRQGVKSARRPVQQSLAFGMLSMIIPMFGIGSLLVIIQETVGSTLPKNIKNSAFWAVVILMAISVFIGSRRAKSQEEVFKRLDKKIIKRYDLYAWLFTLCSIAMVIIMLVVHSYIHA